MLSLMKILLLAIAFILGIHSASKAEIWPESVAVLYNTNLPDSKKLAETYRKARNIPEGNLIGLPMPNVSTMSRSDFEKTILSPLRKEFDTRKWWSRKEQDKGQKIPIENKIKALVTVRGVPLRVSPTPESAAKAATIQPAEGGNPVLARDEASVDSELAMFGVEGLPSAGVLQNLYFKADKSISELNFPFLLLVSRIDGSSFEVCERIIRDVQEAEKTGLWGRAYVDIANKFPQGDEWLETVVKSNLEAGIPTVVDRFEETYPKNYPMTDAASYFGWYDWHINGPFLNSRFRFKKGAVAVHIHSFSAEQLGDPMKNWSAALLQRGAAVTVGNVYEPYLHLTHDLGILQDRLLKGYSWAEACWMAMPVCSWQGIVLGDPLYRPYLHLDGGGKRENGDIEYRALRAAAEEFRSNPLERGKQLEQAAERMKSGVLSEALGLEHGQRKDSANATIWFRKAKNFYVKTEDKLRQDMHIISLDRAANRKDFAIHGLRDAKSRYAGIPESEAISSWLDVLSPPTPPAGKRPAGN